MNTHIAIAPPWTLVSAPPSLQHKVIITGTGRAGTTFLVRLLTALGQDTGYNNRNWQSDYFPHCAAGLERNIADPNSPYIVKDPELCVTLDAILNEGQIAVDHAIVPLRDLESAALSRVRIGGAHGAVPGGLVGTGDPARQQGILAERFHSLVHTLVAHEIPHTFLLFPRFVRDAEYAFEKLSEAIPGLDRKRFMAAFAAIADPTLVHELTGHRPERAAASVAFDQARAAQRRSRHRRRVAAWVGAGVVSVAAVAAWCSQYFAR